MRHDIPASNPKHAVQIKNAWPVSGRSRRVKRAKPPFQALTVETFAQVPLDRTTVGYAQIMTHLTVGQEMPWDRYWHKLVLHVPFLEAPGIGVPRIKSAGLAQESRAVVERCGQYIDSIFLLPASATLIKTL